MATIAHGALTENLTRAQYFLDIHEGTQTGPGTPDNKRRELPRGAVVFAIGALDAYLSEVSAEVMLAQFEQASLTGQNRDVLAKIVSKTPTLALEAALASATVDRRELVRTAITDHFYNQVSNHGAKAVVAAVERMGGSIKDLWQAVSDAGHSSPAAGLDDWTDKRHRIVHQGQKPRVVRADGDRCVKLVRAIGKAVDDTAVASIAALTA